MRLLLSLLFLSPSLALSQIEMRAQALSSGNNAWDSGQDLGVAGPVYLSVYNTGSVELHLAFTQAAATASTPAMRLTQGQRWTFKCGTGCPRKLWAKGVGGIATFTVTASNKYIDVVSHELANPTSLTDASRVRYITLSVGFADLTGTDTETETAATAFPAGAILMGARMDLTTPFTGGTISAITMDCGVNGASLGDVIIDAGNIFTGATTPNFGTGTNAQADAPRDIGGKTLQCTLDATGDDTNDATAGAFTLTAYYTIPAP